MKAVKQISLSLILKADFIRKASTRLDLCSFWKDTLAGAVAARLLAERAKIKNADDIFFLGLLENIGSLTLAYLFPDQYAIVFSDMHQKAISAHDAENQVFGFNHIAAGALLTRSWELPEKFHLPIQDHHNVEQFDEGCSSDLKVRTIILHHSSPYTELFHTLSAISHVHGGWVR